MKRFVSYYRPHRRLFYIDLTAAFLVALCDEFMPIITRRIINEYAPSANFAMMARWSVFLLAIYLVKLGLNWVIGYWGHICGVRIQADMRRELFNHLEVLPVSYFDDHKTGAIMSRIVNDLQEISEMAHHAPENIFISGVMLAVSFVMLARINLALTAIVFSAIPIAVIFAVSIRTKQVNAFARSRAEIAKINAEAETSIAGIRVTKAFNGTDLEEQKFQTANKGYIEARSKAYKYLAIFNSGMVFMTDFMYLVIVVIGGFFLVSGKINAGDFVAFILYISLFLSPLRRLVDTYEMIVEGSSGFKRFCEIIDTPAEQDDPDAKDPGTLEGTIEFDNVTFRYVKEGAKKVIDHVSFTIPKGTTSAFVGPSGGGKTTICNLIPRFYEIEEGEIRIDGTDIRKYTRAGLRRNIGMVAQDVFLFNGTVRDNILYGKPDASDEEMIEAAKKAEIHSYIMSLPDAYDTEVGERGLKLSGGQRQRIAIARVFLKNPKILILDEATSALDNVTEIQIQKSLEKLAEGRTVLVVAHRLSTIRHAQNIFVITEEGIAEEGTHEELLAKNGVYKELSAIA